jgi:hypothetical protein
MTTTFLRILIVLAMSISSYTALAQDTMTITDPRPLAAAMEQLENIYRVPITYEDPARILDWQRTVPDARGHAVPQSETLSFDYDQLPPNSTVEQRAAIVAKAIADAINRYDATHGNKKWFTFHQTTYGFHVVPLLFVDQNAKTQAFTAPLDTLISIPPREQTLDEDFSEILQAVAMANGTRLLPGTGAPRSTPYRKWPTSTLSATSEPARDVLTRLLQQFPVHAQVPTSSGGFRQAPAALSWQLFCDPDLRDGCVLNIHPVPPPTN